MLSSCKTYYFENPQPSHTKDLKSFPSNMIGTYLKKIVRTLNHVNGRATDHSQRFISI